MGGTAVTHLEHGVACKQGRARDAVLRPIDGRDELALCETPGGAAGRANALLKRVLVRLGPIDSVSIEHVRALVLGDREQLLFRLNALSFGPSMDVAAMCPNAECGEPLDIDVDLDVLADAASQQDDTSAAPVARLDGRAFAIRPLTGGDLECVAALAAEDPDAAAARLVETCVGEPARSGDGRLRAAVAEGLVAFDRRAETIVHATCPNCGAQAPLLVDAGALVLDRMAGKRRLLREVHIIARAYHWPEADILALPLERRRAYLDLVQDTELEE